MTAPERVAVVTGAGSGIGAAAAEALAAVGYAVVLAGRRHDPLHELRNRIRAGGGRALAVPTDVTDTEQVVALFETIDEEFGRVDVLFNNAGRNVAPVPIDELSLSDWRAVIDTNVTGTLLCTQAAIRLMRRQAPPRGRIINNGSLSAHAPRPHGAAYTAAKHAVWGLTKATALDCRAAGIACGEIDVNNARTDMTARMPDGVLQPDGHLRPEPCIDVEHVARAVVYMAELPADANVLSLQLMPTQAPYLGRG